MTLEKPASYQSDRNLALDLVRVVEAAALAASYWTGRGDKMEADGAATEAMRKSFDSMPIDGTVVIGEGEMDEAPMLYIGEKVGAGGPAMDIAVDPLEGTTLTAKLGPNALTVIAMAEHGHFLHAPDVYMEKIGVGGGLPPGVVHIDASVGENLRNLAKAKGVDISDLVLCMLDRDRHEHIIRGAREAGARVMLLPDGDVAGVVTTTLPDGDADIFIGTGGAPEGVLAAGALRCVGGQMQGRLILDTQAKADRAFKMGVKDPKKKYDMKELASGDVIVCATGVTDGALLKGVKFHPKLITTETIIYRSVTGTVRRIFAEHRQFDKFKLD